MRVVLYLAAALVVSGLLIAYSYGRWQQLTERERFLLGMKHASHPENMSSEERAKLEVLRAPWWALGRWVPDFWRRRPPV